MSLKTKILLCLVLIGIIDELIPLPIMAMMLIYVLYQKPDRFKRWVDEIYRD
jgi:hypothetical protein